MAEDFMAEAATAEGAMAEAGMEEAMEGAEGKGLAPARG
jgi:hypothetical protein